jgi:predicted aspartyl protease
MFQIGKLLLGLCCWCQIASAFAEKDRIWIDAKVNGKPARFIFDTGSPYHYVLFRQSAERLGLSITNFADENSNARDAYTCKYDLTIGDYSFKTWSWILDLPPAAAPATSADGIIGWPAVTNTVVMIDANTETIDRAAQVPVDTNGWLRLSIDKNSNSLHLLVPGLSGKNVVVVIDTGSAAGVLLNPNLWKKWKSSHKNWPMTMRTGFMFGSGISVAEEACAKEISFGPLTVTDVPVSEAFPTDVDFGGDNYEATFGIAALKRLDLVVDAVHGTAYLRPRKEKAPRYSYNRAAAIFLPRDSDVNLKSQECVAQVMKNGPAYAAGLRDGDVLLKLNSQEIKSWADYIGIDEKVRDLPDGETLNLTLKRGKKIFDVTIVLKNFLVPDEFQ